MDASHLTGHQVPAPGCAAGQPGDSYESRLATARELMSGAAFIRAVEEHWKNGGEEKYRRTRAEMLKAALWWVEARGLKVFPVEYGGKRPAVPHGFKSASSDPSRVRDWWEGRYAGCNIGTPSGYPGPDVLDVEGVRKPGGDGWASFERLKQAGLLAGAHRLVRTPSDGLHVHSAGTDQRSGRLTADHIDFKAQGGYVLLPPSRVYGRAYELIAERPPTGATLNWEAAKRLLEPPRPYRAPRAGSCRRGPGSAGHLADWLEGEYEGNRNAGLFWACCRALEADDEETVSDLADVALSAGLPEAEVRRTVESAYRRASDEH